MAGNIHKEEMDKSNTWVTNGIDKTKKWVYYIKNNICNISVTNVTKKEMEEKHEKFNDNT